MNKIAVVIAIMVVILIMIISATFSTQGLSSENQTIALSTNDDLNGFSISIQDQNPAIQYKFNKEGEVVNIAIYSGWGNEIRRINGKNVRVESMLTRLRSPWSVKTKDGIDYIVNISKKGEKLEVCDTSEGICDNYDTNGFKQKHKEGMDIVGQKAI